MTTITAVMVIMECHHAMARWEEQKQCYGGEGEKLRRMLVHM